MSVPDGRSSFSRELGRKCTLCMFSQRASLGYKGGKDGYWEVTKMEVRAGLGDKDLVL